MQKCIIFLVVILLLAHRANSQTIITKYYDSSWQETSKDSAMYYTTFEKMDTAYKCTSYWIISNKLNCISTYADTNFRKGIGLLMRYYESGVTQDSMYFTDYGNIQTGYHYKENGLLEYRIFYDAKTGGISGEKYDSLGNKILGYFTFQKEAMFPGGSKGWSTYLGSTIRSEVAAKHKAPPGRYTVTVAFMVDVNGKVRDVYALNDPGYGTAQEAVRVIKNGPDWLPAIQNDKPVIYRQKQNIIFEVTEK